MVRTLMPEIDPVLLDKFNKYSLLSDPASVLAGKQPIKPFCPEPFDFESYNWAGPEAASSANTSGPSSAALRLWAKYFSSKDHGLPFVSIPSDWMDFFTLLLLNSTSNEWATNFLKSLAWSHLTSSSSDNGFLFSLPKKKPSVAISELFYSDDTEEQAPSGQSQSPDGSASNFVFKLPVDSQNPLPHQANPELQTSTPSPAPKKGTKRGKKSIISESEVRRSDRLHSLKKGFKPSICKDKNCLGCETKPPLISSSIVRDLGISFCKIDPTKLTEDKLHAKPTAKRAVSKPKAKKTKKVAEKAAANDEAAKDEGKVAKARRSRKAAGEDAASDEAGPSEMSEKDK